MSGQKEGELKSKQGRVIYVSMRGEGAEETIHVLSFLLRSGTSIFIRFTSGRITQRVGAADRFDSPSFPLSILNGGYPR